MPSLSIRPYGDADFDAVISLWLASALTMGIALPVSLDDLRRRWPQELANGWIVHVCVLDDAIAGFIAIKDRHIQQLFVAPERQNQGIGKALLDFAKREMPDGFDLTTATASRASGFYDREGLTRGEISTHPFGHQIVRYAWRPGTEA